LVVETGIMHKLSKNSMDILSMVRVGILLELAISRFNSLNFGPM
jgi:hypothetical protein